MKFVFRLISLRIENFLKFTLNMIFHEKNGIRFEKIIIILIWVIFGQFQIHKAINLIIKIHDFIH